MSRALLRERRAGTQDTGSKTRTCAWLPDPERTRAHAIPATNGSNRHSGICLE